MVVAIDGPAGVGKSTLARHLAGQWNLNLLNTGRYYRAVTFLALERKILDMAAPVSLLATPSAQTLAQMVRECHWDWDDAAAVVDGRRLAGELHSAAIDAWVAFVSEVPLIRESLNDCFRAWSQDHDLVCEGRDVTSAVFPNAEVRIFLDASPEVRALRRFQERPEGMTLEAILASIQARDQIDRNKPVGALKLTPGCILVDSSRLTIKAVCEKVDSIVREHRQ